jgi:alpha-galactosidase
MGGMPAPAAEQRPTDVIVTPSADVEIREIQADAGQRGHRELEVRAAAGTEVTLSWHVPLAGAVGYWTSRVGRTKTLGVDWGGGTTASLTAEAPAGLLFDADSRCTHAFAASETVTPVTFAIGVSEEHNRIHASVRFTSRESPSRLRLYPAGAAYEEVLADIAAWWEALDPVGGQGSLPAALPVAATEPLYSTWYNMHQQLDQGELDAELSRAANLGMRAVIVDDGWQTTDNQRGYAFTGDWEVASARFPDLPAHVRRTHKLGMAELLWVSLPFVGRESAAVREFQHLLLPDDDRHARLWDVRLPDARHHVARICRRLVADNRLDGLKIDFIDQWSSYPPTPMPPEADTDDYTVGVDLLLSEIVTALRAVVENPLIEFRQRYIGPRMLHYGNIFRVADCPANGYQNRVSSVDLRHLIKSRAVHADMVMWAPDDPAEVAAEQLLCTAFSVPQISMLIRDLPGDHVDMLRQYLRWWTAHRGVLIDGWIRAPRPDLGYPVVTSTLGDESVSVAYSPDAAVVVATERTTVGNATGTQCVLVDLPAPGSLESVTDCFGASQPAAAVQLPRGPQRLPIPRGGSALVTCS